jgi:hypothetical protein
MKAIGTWVCVTPGFSVQLIRSFLNNVQRSLEGGNSYGNMI